MRILLIEDDVVFAAYLAKALRQNGHVPIHTTDARDGLHMAQEEVFDGIILDRRLSGIDGLAIVAALRATGHDVPIIITSVLSDVGDRIRGLETGGDDYLPKPFSIGELLARLAAVASRRSPAAYAPVLRVGDLEVDLPRRRVTRAGNEISLLPQEFKLLEYMARHAGQVLTRTMILENVWDYHFDPRTNVVDVQVSRLRAKIDRNHTRKLIWTLRGFGYMISDRD